MIKKFFVLSMLMAVVAVLCSCGKPDIRKPAGRLVAQAAGEKTSDEHIDGIRGHAGGMTNEPGGQLAALDRVRAVEQDLLAHEAIQGSLDRDEKIAQTIERARLQILAQAYIDRISSSAPQASPREIKKFYEENPALFERRRLYRVLELTVVVAPEQLGALQDAVADAKNVAMVVRWLDSRRLPFEAAMTSRTADQIPMNVLHRLFEMHDGEIAVFPTPGGASVLRLVQSADAPLSEKQARPAIAQYLLNRNRIDIAQAVVTKLRERAKAGHDRSEPVRPATATQIAAQAQPRIASPGMERNTIDFARLR
jgi:EpsD family peptidyl-prolyl cis-trans isomerase